MLGQESDARGQGRGARALRRAPGLIVRALLVAVLVVLNLELLYLATANLMIRTGYLRAIMNIDPDTAQITYDSGWTVWPGEVHVSGYRLRVQDTDLQFSLAVDEAIADIELTELFGLTFHTTRVRASGVVFRMRGRLTELEAEQPWARSLPPIEGFSDPPMRGIGPPKAPLTDETYNLWTAHLEDVDVTVREVWIDNHRFDVDARVRGGFYFKPLRAMEMQVLVDLADGQLHVAEREAAHGVEGRVEITIDRTDIRENEGPALLRALTGAIRIDAQIPGLSFLDHYLDTDSVRLEDGSGELRANAAVVHGVISDGSLVSFATRRLDLVTPAFRATVHAEARAAVRVAPELLPPGPSPERPGEPAPPVGFLEVRVLEAALRARDMKGTLLELEDATMRLETSSRDLAGPVNDVAARFDVPGRVPDLRVFNGEDAGDPAIDSGIAFLRAGLRIDPRGRATGSIRALTGRLRGHWGALKLGGDVSAGIDIESERLLEGTLQAPRGHIELKNVVYARDGERKEGWWGRIDLARVKVRRQPDVAIDASIRGKFKNAEPFMELPATYEALPGLVRGLLEMENLAFNGEIVRRGGELVLSLNKAEGDGATVWGRLQVGKSAPRGAVLVKIGPITAGVVIGADGVDFTLLPGEAWITKHLPPARKR